MKKTLHEAHGPMIQQEIEDNREKLEKRGIPASSMRAFDSGTRAIVYDIGNDKVFKVSDDDSDAQAMAKAKRLGNLKYVVKVFDVFKFPNRTGFYGIVLEKLKPIPGASFGDDFENRKSTGQALSLDTAIFMTYLGSALKKPGTWDQILNTMEHLAKEDNTDPFGNPIKFNKEKFDGYVEVLKKWKIPEMVDEFHSHGITFSDYHSKNIMLKGSDPKVVDLGYSIVRGEVDLDVLEKKTKLKEFFE